MKGTSGLWVFVLSVAMLAGSTAHAYRLTFTPYVSVSEEYNDNLFLTDDDEEHSFITVVSPGFDLEFLLKTAGLNLNYEPGYVFYSRFSEFDTWRHNASLYSWWDVAKNLKLELRDEFRYTDELFLIEDLEALALEEPLTEADYTARTGRNTYYTNTGNLRLTYMFGENDEFYVDYVHTVLENDDPAIQDNQSHRPSAGLTYWFVPHWALEAEAILTLGEFDFSDDFAQWVGRGRLIHEFTRHLQGYAQYRHTYRNYDGETENYHVYAPSLGVAYQFAEDASIDLAAGYFVQDIEDGDDESGPYLEGMINKSWATRRSEIDVSLVSGYGSADFGAESLGFNTYYGMIGSGVYGFTPHLGIDGEASWVRVDYTGLETDRTDDNIDASCGIEYQPWQWMSLRLEYSFRMRESDIEPEEFKENRVMFQIRFTLSPPLRITS